jgi:hypothetical protein
MPDGTEPVSADESVMRRVYAGSGFYNRDRVPYPLSERAFWPLKQDLDGISVVRTKYATPQAAAAGGFAGKSYYIIEIAESAILNIGLQTLPKPTPQEAGHAVIPTINSTNVATDFVREKTDQLRKLPYVCHGPFPGTKPPPPSRADTATTTPARKPGGEESPPG